jgi:hypothetical protein
MATRPMIPANPAPTFSAPLEMRGPVVAGGAVGVIGTPAVGAGAPGTGVVVMIGTGAGVGGVPGTGVTVTTGMV